MNNLPKILGIFWVFYWVCFIIACGQSNFTDESTPPEINGIIDIEDIYQVVNVYPLSGCIIVDKLYDLPTKRWIETTFKNRLKEKLFGKKYQLESFDCDSYVATAYCLSNELGYYGINQLAIGEFFFIKDTGVAHAINFILCKEDGEIKRLFFEPQNGEFIQLSEKEIASTIFWKI